MDRAEFIITVYCVVCEQYCMIHSQSPVRRGGFAPALSDEEVITMEICGEYFKLATDKDLFAYFRTHYAHFFPQLRERTLFVRQAANRWRVKTLIQQHLTVVSGQAEARVQIIDTLPLPVCSYTRSGRDRCFPTLADYGHCAAKKLDYYGFKLGLRITRCDMIIHYPLLPTRPHDIRFWTTWSTTSRASCPPTKALSTRFARHCWPNDMLIVVITPPRRGRTPPHSPALLKFCAWIRKEVETVGAQLTERFAVARIRVHDMWHFHHRLIRKILAHTVGVFLNLQLRHPPLDLDGLVTV